MPHKRRKSAARASSASSKDVCGVYERGPDEFHKLQPTRPENLRSKYVQCRRWMKDSWFIETVTTLRARFYNYGMTLQPVTGKKTKQFTAWEEKHQREIRNYARDVWTEFLTTSVVISFWRESGLRPVVIPPENVEYKDAEGERLLKIKAKSRVEEQEAWKKLPPETLRKYGSVHGWQPVHPALGLHFDISKSNPEGWGLPCPRMNAAFLPAAAIESLEVSDKLWADKGRIQYEQHRKGHEIKNPASTDPKVHFWTKVWSDSFLNLIRGRTGNILFTGNFDHEIKYPYPDPKFLDKEKYEGALERLMWWAMPLGHMIIMRGGVPSPYLMNVLEAQAQDERDEIGAHLANVISQFYKPPGGAVKVTFSNRIFRDTRLFMQLLQFGLKAGPVSPTTFNEQIGLNDEEERARKAAAAKAPKTEVLPLHDPDHGAQPGAPNTPGRPPGRGDDE